MAVTAAIVEAVVEEQENLDGFVLKDKLWWQWYRDIKRWWMMSEKLSGGGNDKETRKGGRFCHKG